MSTVRINVGGKEFVASRSTWAKSPVLDMILRRSADPVPFVDRSPDVFDHILDWLREGKLYINCPSNRTYKRLCADAKFYGLKSLRKFLKNRFNLCSFIYFLSPNGDLTFCDLDAFRTLEPADGIIDRLFADNLRLSDLLITNFPPIFISPDTVSINAYLRGLSDILSAPHLRRSHYSNGNRLDGERMLFGSRFTGSGYEPKLRAERSS